jgi:hypothetical protein
MLAKPMSYFYDGIFENKWMYYREHWHPILILI